MARTTRALLSAAVFAVSSLACLDSAWAVEFTERYANTSTLLPNGDILICGGQTAVGVYTNDCQISLEQVGDYFNSADMGTTRSSFTATLLPNGQVLVTGGYNGAALNTAEVYDPIANSWAATGNNMAASRFNHTATLLRTGKVLVCGGQSNLAGGSLASCDLYDPATNTFAATGALAAGRGRHIAVLRRDGKVWAAGGFDVTTTPQFLVTSETYDPTAGTWSSARSLIVARADFSATMMGDGRVLVAGGYNGKNVKENLGYLDTAEIYDPVSDSIVPTTSLNTRKSLHAATLLASGEVAILGGLGNVTTTYTLPFVDVFDESSYVGGNAQAGSLASSGPIMNVNAAMTDLRTTIDVKLGTLFSGVIASGDIFLSTTQIATPEGALIWLAPGYTTNTAVGTRLNLDGRRVTCPVVSGNNECGHIEGQFLDSRMPNQTGTYWIPPLTPTGIDNFILTDSHRINFNQAFTSMTVGVTVTSATVRGTTRIHGFPAIYGTGGVTISSAMLPLTGGSFTQTSSFTVTITAGHLYIPAGVALVPDPDGGAMTAPFTAEVAYSGTVAWAGDNADQAFAAATTIPMSGPSGPVLPNISIGGGRLTYLLDRVPVPNVAYSAEIATTVVRRMISSDWEVFRPYDAEDPSRNNSWRFAYQMFGGYPARWGTAISLRPDGVARAHGGLDCLNATCTTFDTHGSTASYGLLAKNFQDFPGSLMSARRGNHSSTLLPNGKILVAGGTNGPNVLDTADIFDPATRTFTPTGKMYVARDLHSAILMPNGRVLVAGGFATTATSSGATNTAEVYHPDTGLWHRTPPMISSHSNHATVLLHSGDVMVIGGYANGTYLDSVEIYYSTGNVWRVAAPLPALCGAVTCARAQGAAAVLHDGRVLVSGGLNASGILGTSLVYNPATGAWSYLAGGDFANGRHAHSHSLSTLPDGLVIAAGGDDEFGDIDLSQAFDPKTNTWSNRGALVTGRFNHSAVVTPDGVISIAGGSQALGNSIKYNELFTPSLSTWTAATELVIPRSYGTATLGNDGYLYYIGGYDGFQYLDTFERTYYTAFPDLHTRNAPPSTRLPIVAAADPPVVSTATILTLTGSKFHGETESSGGNGASMSSSHFHPRVVLQRNDGASGTGSMGSAGFTIDLTTRIYRAGSNPAWNVTNSSISILLPSNPGQLPRGWYQARVGASAVYSDALMLQVGPDKPANAPTALAAAALGISSMVWTWTAPVGGGHHGYDVWSGTSGIFIATAPLSGVVPAQGTPCAGPCHFQTDLGPNTSVQLNVAGYNLSGDGPLVRSTTFFTLAALPSSFQISSVTADSILLTWSTNGNRDGTIYEISQSSDNFLTGPIISTPTESLNLQTTFFTISPLAENTTYYFRLRAFNGANVPTAFTTVVSTRTRSPVFGLIGSPASPTSVNWSWNNPGGVINYRVYNATSGALLASPSVNSYLDTGLSTNSARSVQISAVTGAGEGPLCPSVTVYTLSATPGLAAQPFLFVGTGSFVVNWTQNQNPPNTQFQLWVSSNAGLSVSTAQTTSLQAGMSNLTDEGEIWETRVYSLNGDNVLSVPLLLGSTPTLAGPINSLSLVGTGPDSIAVAWSSFSLYGINTASVTYQLTYSTDDFATNITTAIPFASGFNGFTAVISSLLTSTTYSIRLAARNAVGRETSFSNIITTRTDSGAGIGQIGGDIFTNQNMVLTGTLGTVPPRRVTVQVPAGTFSSDVRLVISSQPMAGNNLCATGNTSTSTVGINLTVTPAIQPSGVFYVTVGYEATEIAGLNASKLMLLRHEPSFGKCVPIESYVNTTDRRVTGKLDHLSLFQIGAVAPAGTTEGARIFPNPWYSSRTGQVTFHQLPADAKIRIFTARGELVHEFDSTPTGIVSWNGHNRGGRRVSSGVYLVVIESGGSRKILKLVVLR